MGYPVQQSSTTLPLTFLMIDSTDHVSGKTGLGSSITVTLSKNGASFAAPVGAISEIGNGRYKVAPNATDNSTLGVLSLHAVATGADPTDEDFLVVAYDPTQVDKAGFSLASQYDGIKMAASGGFVQP
jgi:hypothetical protein